MNKRLFALMGVVLCAVVASAGITTLRKRAAGGAASAEAARRAPRTPVGGEAAKASALHAAPQEQEQARAAQTPANNVPEHVLYWHMFRHHNFMHRKADEAERKGEDSSYMRNFYKREAKLDDSSAAALRQVAAEVEIEVGALDAQARKIIDAYRAKQGGGELKKGQPLPPPPAELAALQERRDSAILNARQRLRLTLGEGKFGEFNKFMREKVAPQIKPKSLDSLRPASPGGERRKPKSDPYKERKK